MDVSIQYWCTNGPYISDQGGTSLEQHPADRPRCLEIRKKKITIQHSVQKRRDAAAHHSPTHTRWRAVVNILVLVSVPSDNSYAIARGVVFINNHSYWQRVLVLSIIVFFRSYRGFDVKNLRNCSSCRYSKLRSHSRFRYSRFHDGRIATVGLGTVGAATVG